MEAKFCYKREFSKLCCEIGAVLINTIKIITQKYGMKRIPLPCVEEMDYLNANKWKVYFKS